MIQYFRENTPEIGEILSGYGYSLSDTKVVLNPTDERGRKRFSSNSDLMSAFIKTQSAPSEDKEIAEALRFVPGAIVGSANREYVV